MLRLVQSFFTAFSGPCSYSLISDWIAPHQRTLAFAFYALGVQFGVPISKVNSKIIEWLGWRASFQFLALISFIILAVSFTTFDEPDRGRFDISYSIINNPNETLKSFKKFNGY